MAKERLANLSDSFPFDSVSCPLTLDASVGDLKVRHKVSLTRVEIDETSYADVTGGPDGALAVEVGLHVLCTSDVELAADALTRMHPSELGRIDEDHVTEVTGHVERLIQAELKET